MNAQHPASDATPSGDQNTDSSHADSQTIVVKVGGSLLDLPDLADRLHQFLASCETPRLILVIGGGPVAELVRQRDRHDDLDCDKSHWLAVRAMSFNSFLIEAMLPNSVVVLSIAQCE